MFNFIIGLYIVINVTELQEHLVSLLPITE